MSHVKRMLGIAAIVPLATLAFGQIPSPAQVDKTVVISQNADGQSPVAVAGGNGVNYWVRAGGKKEKAAFLGVTAEAADSALRSQLKLNRGIGLVIKNVQDKTPAADAGLQENDVITKLDDQWLVNQQQFGVLIRMHKAGDEITLTGLREGAPIAIKAKLMEKEMVVSDDGMFTPIAGGLGNFQIADAEKAAEEIKQKFMLDDDDDTPLLIKEHDQTLKVSVKDKQRHLVATDENGQILFDGPVETDEQRKALPNDLAEELEKYKEQFNQVKEGGHQRIRIINNR